MDNDKSLFVVGVLMVLFLASSGLASAACFLTPFGKGGAQLGDKYLMAGKNVYSDILIPP